MKKKTLAAAISALLLLAGAALAEPPRAATPDRAPLLHRQGVEQLPEADLAAVTGAGWWSGACTVGLIVAGNIGLVLSSTTTTPVDDGVFVGLIWSARAICT